MRSSLFRASLGAVVLLSGQAFLAGATIAADAPPTIMADMPSAVPAGHQWAFNDYFPRTFTVAQGNTVDFALLGFHTATLLPTGTTPSADEVAAGILTTDADDSAPNPNGTTHTELHQAALMPTSFTCGSNAVPCAFDGSTTVSSGVPSGPAPFAVHVTAPTGTYAFHCRIHPGMVGWLHVVAPSAPVPSASDVAAAVATQVAADVTAGYAAEDLADHQSPHHNADGTTTWTMSAGTSSPDGRTAILEMLPRNVHIRKGDAVRWISPAVNEPHTVTFPQDLGTNFVPACEAGAADGPCFGPPDEIEGAPGNGVSHVTSPSTVSDSGFLSSTAEAAAFGLPQSATLKSWTVSFAGAVAGTYHYVCQIHDGMAGAVTVVPGR